MPDSEELSGGEVLRMAAFDQSGEFGIVVCEIQERCGCGKLLALKQEWGLWRQQ